MSGAVDLAILIPTFRGRESLPRLFDSLVRMRRVPAFRVQIVVIDNNSPDDTRSLVRQWQPRIAELEYLFHAEPGKCHALNAGLAASSARWVAFLDHDVEVDEAYLEGIHRAVTMNPDFHVFGGRILADRGEALPYWVNRGQAMKNSRGGIIAHDYGDENRAYDASMRLPVGANFFCQRDLFDRVGPFDVRLGPRPGAQIAGEESELLHRFMSAGERILYCADAAVHHPIVRERVSKRYFRYRHFCDGRAGCLVVQGSGSFRSIFGVPIYLFKATLKSLYSWVTSLARFDAYEIFNCELELWYYLGAMYQYRLRSVAAPRDTVGSANGI